MQYIEKQGWLYLMVLKGNSKIFLDLVILINHEVRDINKIDELV